VDDLMFEGVTRRAVASLVSGNYFEVLGVRSLKGRLFSDADDRLRSGHTVVVISYGFWVERFGMRPDVVGQNVRIGGHPFSIIGIAEKSFNGLEVGGSVDVFVPTMMLGEVVNYGKALDARNAYIFHVYGRLKSGVSAERATAQLQPLYLAELEQDIAAMGARWTSGDTWRQGRIILEEGHRGTSGLRSDLETPLTAVMAMTIVLLVIACANIAGLQISRASARMKEISIRLAMGASRRRVVRQLVTESALTVVAGGLAGLWVAAVTISALVGEMGETGNRLQLVTTFLNEQVLVVTLGFAAATTVLVGLVPALLATRPAVWPALRAAVSDDIGGQMRLRRVLVTVQLAFSLVLLIASGLFGRTVYNLRHADAGFRSDHLIQFQLNTGAAGYDRGRSEAAFRQVLEGVESIPGAEAATLAVAPMLDNALMGFALDVEGYSGRNGRARAGATVVAPGYFRIVGTPLLLGRDFSESDTAQSHRVAIVSEAFVKRYFQNVDPIGRTISFNYGGAERFQHEIVGVSKDARLNNLRDEPAPTFYLPYTQFNVLNRSSFVVRTAIDPNLLRRHIEELVRRYDPEVPVMDYATIDQKIDRLLRPERLVASLSLSFGLLATGLAAIGLYGVMGFTVARRTREIGIRIALGAVAKNISWLVLREVVVLVAIGLAFALPAIWGLANLVKSQLYGITPLDPLTMAVAVCLLTLTALAAGVLPARRAARVDPLVALRYE
jgi:predicted permease